MANKKISALTAKTTPVAADEFAINDVAGGSTKKVTLDNIDDVLKATTQTITNKTIDGDNNTITNLAIGAEVTGASTDLTDTAALTYNADTDVSGNGYVLDEDNMASDSATKLASQQSIKAYVDLKAPIANPTFTGEIGIGAVNVSETELGILEGATTTTAELNILDGVTSTTAELNILDGVTATATELNYVDGVTSAIQTQLDAKSPSTAPTFATSITGSYLTASEILITNGSKDIVSAPVATYPSLTELAYVKGVTSAIQTQIDAIGAPEGTAVLSTGEAGGSKFLREDGDGTCSWQALAGGGDALTSNGLDQFAATTSAELAGVISNETGSGLLVFNDSPALITPDLGTPASGVATNLTGTAAGLTVGATTGVEAGADVTDTANVTSAGALMDSELTSIADVKALDQSVVNGASPVFDGTNFTNIPAGTVDVVSNVATARVLGRTTAGSGNSEELTASSVRTLINVEDGADVTDATNVQSAGALMDSELTSIADVKALDQSVINGASPVLATTNMTEGTDKNFVTDAEATVIGNTSGSNSGDQDLSTYQVKPSEGAFVDGDKTKLDGIETSADVTDTANVTSAGALMDSELTDIVAVKALTDASIADTDTGTSTTAFVTPDGLQGSKRNVRWLVFNVVDRLTDCEVLANVGGDFVSPIAGTILQSDSSPFYIYATNSTAGTTGTMVVDVHLNGTTIMTTNKLDFDTTEKTTTTAATPPDLTDTTIAVGDILTIDIDAIHTTAAKGLTVYIGIREN